MTKEGAIASEDTAAVEPTVVTEEKPTQKTARKRRLKRGNAKNNGGRTVETKTDENRRTGGGNKTRKQGGSSRIAINDLPPDRQAEISGRRLAGEAKRKHVYRPKVPEIQRHIEIHTHEVGLLFTRDFTACNEYAVAIDYVARERLRSRAEFNKYLGEFQEVLDELSGSITSLYKSFEERSNGGMTKAREPHAVEVGLQSNRSMQLLELYKSADDIIRMVQFVTIFGDLPDDEGAKAILAVERALARCVKGLRNVKVRCFRRIVEVEALRLPVKSETTLEELEGARRVASIKGGEAKAVKSKKRPRPTVSPTLDPNAPASIPSSTEDEIESDGSLKTGRAGGEEQTIPE